MTDTEARATATSKSTATAAGNIVEGFSTRFNQFLDRAGWPQRNRLTQGARRFDVAHNTFKFWMTGDRIPGSHALLLEVVGEILKDFSGYYNPRAVAAWLLTGDAVPNPFEGDNQESLHRMAITLHIVEVAKAAGIDYLELPREARSQIIRRVQELVTPNSNYGPVEFDDTTMAVLNGMLEMAVVMRKS